MSRPLSRQEKRATDRAYKSKKRRRRPPRTEASAVQQAPPPPPPPNQEERQRELRPRRKQGYREPTSSDEEDVAFPPHNVVYTYEGDANGEIDIYMDNVLTLLVRPSALLQSLGVQGRGLYAARQLPEGFSLGYYSGLILDESAKTTRCLYVLTRQKKDQYLMDITSNVPHYRSGNKRSYTLDALYPLQSDAEQQTLFRYVPFPNHIYMYPGSFIHLMNDPQGSPIQPTCTVFPNGRAFTNHVIPAYNPQHPLPSELLWDYTDNYWNGRHHVEGPAPFMPPLP